MSCISFENDDKLLGIDIYGGKMIHFILRLWNQEVSSKVYSHCFSFCILFLTEYFLFKFSSNTRTLKLTFEWSKLLSTKRGQYVPFASLCVHGWCTDWYITNMYLVHYQISLKPQSEHQCLLFPYVIMRLSAWRIRKNNVYIFCFLRFLKRFF